MSQKTHRMFQKRRSRVSSVLAFRALFPEGAAENVLIYPRSPVPSAPHSLLLRLLLLLLPPLLLQIIPLSPWYYWLSALTPRFRVVSKSTALL